MNYPVNSTDFTIYRYVDNEIDFMVKNIDRAPIPFANATATIHILDSRHQRLLLTRELTVVDEAKGHLRLFLTGNEASALPAKTLKYTVVMTRPDNVQVMLYTDRNRKASGAATVVDGPLPDPIDPIELTMEDFILRQGVYYSGAYAGAKMVANESGLHSVALRLVGFTGNVTVQGSIESAPTQDDGSWFPVSDLDYDDHTGMAHIPFEGQLMWVRFLITKTSGEVETITYRN